MLGRSVCGACVCLAGGKEKEEENRNWVVSGSRLPSLRLVSPSISVAGEVGVEPSLGSVRTAFDPIAVRRLPDLGCGGGREGAGES